MNTPNWIVLTSTRGTPMFVRVAPILFVEGFDFAEDHPHCPNVRGSRLTLAAGQWSEAIHAQEDAPTVLDAIAKAEAPAQDATR